MKREDIEKAADEYSEQDLERFKHDEYWEYLADELVCGAREDANIGAFIAGAEWMQEQHKVLDVHTDNSDVIANLQAEVEKLKVEKKQMMDKALRDLNEMYFLTRLCDNLQIKQELKDEAEQCNNN